MYKEKSFQWRKKHIVCIVLTFKLSETAGWPERKQISWAGMADQYVEAVSALFTGGTRERKRKRRTKICCLREDEDVQRKCQERLEKSGPGINLSSSKMLQREMA